MIGVDGPSQGIFAEQQRECVDELSVAERQYDLCTSKNLLLAILLEVIVAGTGVGRYTSVFVNIPSGWV